MLTCEKINAFYGPAHVLFDIDVAVGEGQMVCLLGRNGVGKSSCLKAIMGLVPIRSGSIRFGEQEISALPPYEVARAGVGYVPEDRRIFVDLTVEENLEVVERAGGPWNRAAVYGLFPALQEFRKRRGGLLSGGQQQMLTIARTLVCNPRLLLIDEPTEGLSPIVVKALQDMIRSLKSKGQTMLLASQDLRFSLSVADVVYVLDRGRIVYRGDGADANAEIEAIRDMLAV